MIGPESQEPDREPRCADRRLSAYLGFFYFDQKETEHEFVEEMGRRDGAHDGV